MPFCPECGKSVGPFQKFCRNCGASLIEELPAAVPPATTTGPLSCHTCGAPLATDEKFCGNCGIKAGDAPAPAAPAPAAILPYPAVPVPVTCPTPAPAPVQAVAPVVSGLSAGRLVCLLCGTSMTRDMKFCGNCGTLAQAAAVLPAPPAYQPPPPSPPPQNAGQSPTPPVAFSAPSHALVCPGCGNPVGPGDKFCSRCFRKVPDTAGVTQGAHPTPFPHSAAAAPGGYVCASCGSPVTGLEKFCGICGATVVAARAPAAQPDPAAPTAPAAKFCGNCGEAISSATKFCGSCGAAVNTFPG